MSRDFRKEQTNREAGRHADQQVFNPRPPPELGRGEGQEEDRERRQAADLDQIETKQGTEAATDHQ